MTAGVTVRSATGPSCRVRPMCSSSNSTTLPFGAMSTSSRAPSVVLKIVAATEPFSTKVRIHSSASRSRMRSSIRSRKASIASGLSHCPPLKRGSP